MALLTRRSRAWFVLVLVLTLASGTLVGAGLSPAKADATADVTAVAGRAFNYYSDVSLFGGPYTRRGYGQPDDAPQAAASPSVECPEVGGNGSMTDPDGARGQYGPAVIFGGIWADENAPAPPSGPLTSSIDCALGEGGGVTASTEVTLMPSESGYPGGVGPGPFVADEVHSSCTMTADGLDSDVTINNGILETTYDPDTQEPVETEPVPQNPEPNYTRTGTIDHVGDRYEIVFNEQIVNPDGSFTVNAAHLYLLGPTAEGDMVIGSSTCDVEATEPAPTTTEPTDTPTEPADTTAGSSDASTAASTDTDATAASTDTEPTDAEADADADADATMAAAQQDDGADEGVDGDATVRAAQRDDAGAATASAFNYYTDVSLFGGPKARRGYGQPANAPGSAASPLAQCPDGGGSDSDSDPDGATAKYGPAVIFGGIWPDDHSSAPPSGPLTSEADCQDGEVSASTTVSLMPSGSAYPGGVGPGPVIADEVHSSCTKDADGVTSGNVTIVNGTLETKYDEDTQEATKTEPIPEKPEPNYTREGTIDHVGDRYRVTFNEQLEQDDGSFTVNAVHMELLGPTAVGDMIIGQSNCGGDPVDAGTGTPIAGGAGGAGGAGDGSGGSGSGGSGSGGSGSGSAGSSHTRGSNSGLARTGASDPRPVAALGIALMLLGTIALQGGRLGGAARPARR